VVNILVPIARWVFFLSRLEALAHELDVSLISVLVSPMVRIFPATKLVSVGVIERKLIHAYPVHPLQLVDRGWGYVIRSIVVGFLLASVVGVLSEQLETVRGVVTCQEP
jgi:hypothetical protein